MRPTLIDAIELRRVTWAQSSPRGGGRRSSGLSFVGSVALNYTETVGC